MQQETTTRKSFIAWIGGKSHMVDRIVPLMSPHECYCEVFAGAAWLLFRKPESKVEIINDINLDLVTLYRVVKHHLDEFVRYTRWLLVSREEFERFKATPAETMTDVQRAVRFYYLMKTGFGARVRSPSFGVTATRPSPFNLLRIEEDLSAAHIRLARVFVENLPYADAITRFDKPGTFFYVDPPYFGSEDYYGKGLFGGSDFTRLAELLAVIKGRFCLSINDTPEMRAVFKAFRIRSVKTRYTVNGPKQRPAAELLVFNYQPKAG